MKKILFLILVSLTSYAQRTITQDKVRGLETALAGKKEIVTSIASLQAITNATVADFDGSTWVKKSGNVTSNGGGFAGTIIRVDGSNYWERQFIGDLVDIEWFGGLGNGIYNNKNAIIKANEYCSFAKKKIFFKNGVYLTDGISLLNCTKIAGESIDNTIIKFSNIGYDNGMFVMEDKDTLEVSNITLKGNNSIGHTVFVHAITKKIANFYFEKVKFSEQNLNLKFTGLDSLRSIENVKIVDCIFDNARNTNVELLIITLPISPASVITLI